MLKDVIYILSLVSAFFTVVYKDIKTSFLNKRTSEKTQVNFGRF
ncbi:hypothetical protein ABIB50_001459 [Mucilaginibacter sp. UYCu711]